MGLAAGLGELAPEGDPGAGDGRPEGAEDAVGAGVPGVQAAPEVRRAARWPRPDPPTLVKWPPTYRIEEEMARASTSPLVATFQTGVPPTVGP